MELRSIRSEDVGAMAISTPERHSTNIFIGNVAFLFSIIRELLCLLY